MGGKTQQRVAGNLKPASSGRTRELLINKHGSGNPFVTFSALSTSTRKQQETSEKTDRNHLKHQNKDPDVRFPTSDIKSSISTEQTHETKNNRPILVVKRVGNREFFTRVRFAQDVDEKSNQSSIVTNERKNISSNSDPEVEVSDEIGRDISQLEFSSSQNQSIESPESTSSESEDNDDDLQEDNFGDSEFDNFDALLDRLSILQSSTQYDRSGIVLKELSSAEIEQEIKLIKILTIMLKKYHQELSIVEWDLIVQSIHRWISMISQTEKLLGLPENINSLCTYISKFTNEMISLIRKCEIDDLEELSPMLRSLLDDWKNFFRSKAYQDLIISYFKIALEERYTDRDLLLVKWLTGIIIDIDPTLIMANRDLPHVTEPELDSDIRLPKDHSFCRIDDDKSSNFTLMNSLLKKNHRFFTILAHSMLSKVMTQVCTNLLVSSNNSELGKQDRVEDLFLLPPSPTFSVLTSRDLMMSALLGDYKAGDISVTIEPSSDAYTCTLSYLLMWDLVINFIVESDKEASHCMIHSLKRLGLIPRLLDNIFMLLPPLGDRETLNYRYGYGTGESGSGQLSLVDFLRNPLRVNLRRAKNEIELIALHVFFSIARHMPVTVRKWYNNNSNKRLCNLVNEYTVKHISKVICSLEMETVQSKCQERAEEDKLKHLNIKARPNAREVYALYTRDEFTMELTIKLPINYPLGPVQIDGGKRVGVTDVKWRSWLLQLTRFLAHQNGPLLEGIDLWRRNIDKRFEGVEKCMICFSILHSNYQLPGKRCQTCSKNFHNICIYKWFESSGNSTCPLCRNIW